MHAFTFLRPLVRPIGFFVLAGLASLQSAPTAPAARNLSKRPVDGPSDSAHIVIDAHGSGTPAPVFFSTVTDGSVQIASDEITGEWRIKLHLVQGRPELLSIGLSGNGQVIDVTGSQLRDWAVRQTADSTGDRRFLDLRPQLSAGESGPRDYEFVVHTRLRKPALPGVSSVLMPAPGDAVGFASTVTLQANSDVDFRVTTATGMIPVGENTGTRAPLRFSSFTEGKIEVTLAQRGAATGASELLDAQLSGRVDESAHAVAFQLRAQWSVQKAGARLRLLSGQAALDEKSVGDGWHVELVANDGAPYYDLVADREGLWPLALSFVATIVEDGDWRRLDFKMPAGAVVPLRLDGLAEKIEFDRLQRVVPSGTPQGWQGFLPGDGVVALAWKNTRKAGEGTLFFTSTEQTEVRVAAGLLRQESHLAFKILQGKLAGVRLHLDGPSEILGVFGANVLSWAVVPASSAEGRMLDVKLSRPFEGEGALVVRSQTTLDGFPVRAQPLRLTPENTVRHSGFLRIANHGAVRLEIAEVGGLMQLAPAQFPGAAIEGGARRIFVYRFPSSDYGYRIVASQIQPEISVSEVVTYELTETDRVINAELELDVREATVRDWSLKIPEDYAVVTLTGNGVVDHTTESAAADGLRILKIFFDRPVEGRQLITLRLEKNQPAAAGEWRLTPLAFPGAKSVRGQIGAVSSPGYRIIPSVAEKLVEVPLSFFPRQTTGLQQAWRVRDANWSAVVRLDALGQSIQADVFHLYSLREGAVYGSVLFNFFVVGAPASEWRIEVPEAVGNIDVVGQNVRRDWRREGNQVIVTLHQPVLGAATLLVTFEQPMSARGGVIHPGELRPLGVQSERGFLQVVSPLQVKHSIQHADGGLLKLEPLELPAEYRLLTSSPSLAVYQYTARPFNLELGLEWYPQVDTIDQVVDFARLSSQVSRDGQVVTDARYFVKTRGRKSLRLVLPAGMKLWEARVDQAIVTARLDGDQTLVPLPARLNPNEPVEVALRLGQSAGQGGTTINLLAPKMSVPIVIDEWTLHSDAERLLVPKSGNAELLQTPLVESGFTWIARHGRGQVALLLSLLAVSAILLRGVSAPRMAVGLLMCAVVAGFAILLAGQAWNMRQGNLSELTYSATVMPTGEAIAIKVANVPVWRAMISWTGLGAFLAGFALLVVARVRTSRLTAIGGILLLAAGVLAQRLGAVPFFLMIAASVLLFMFGPALFQMITQSRDRSALADDTGPGAGATVSMIALLCTLGLGFGATPTTRASEAMRIMPVTDFPSASGKTAQSIVQNWSIRESRLFAELEVTVRGVAGDSFVLLNAPAVLTDFKCDVAHVSKVEANGRTNYHLVLDRDGVANAHARFELGISDLTQPLTVPTGLAAIQRITVEFDQPGWEFVSPSAVQVVAATGLPANHSGATLTLRPAEAAVIQAQPQQRNVTVEATQYFAELASVFVPGPGVVNGYARVTVRPAQGRVTELELEIPKGYTVGDVSGGPIGSWRFDPEKRRLHVSVEPAQTNAFRFNLETQASTGALPAEVRVEPVKIPGAAGEVGLIALAFGGDAQPENVRAENLSPVNVEDLDATLVPRTTDGQPLATVQHVWRHGRENGHIDLKVAPVSPEVRVATRTLLTLDDDRLVSAVELNVAITRVGLFQLSFALPTGLEIEALSGPSLNHWTESAENGIRLITLHLNGRTIGEQRFNVSLAGPAPHAQAAWAVPRLQLREATRQTGELLLVPGKGIRLHTVDRENATQLDPRSVGGELPGTLAFRLLQEDWSLHIGIEALDAWVTAQALQEVTVREGQTLTRLNVRYHIENAAVKQLRIRLPDLTAAEKSTVRATGSAVSDFIPVAGEADVWEIRFQRGIAGDTDVQIEFQGATAGEAGRSLVSTPVFVGARQTTQFVAVRSGGRMELDVADLPRGWQRADWGAVPPLLQSPADRTVPVLCFRVAEPERALALALRRNDVADALKLRVTSGNLTTLFSPEGASLTAVDLRIDVVEKSTLRVQLPTRATLFNTFVNGDSVAVVRDGDTCLFHVSPNTGEDRSAMVRLVYATSPVRAGRIELSGPGLSIPLENVTWQVALPPGYKLDDYRGSLRLQDDRSVGSFSLAQYQQLVVSTQSIEAKKATALFEEATALVRRGEQQQASEILSRAAKNNALDRATNEDARIQLKELKTQQAVLGLTTRRQRLYLDNRGDAPRNEQIEQAVTLNPFMQGKTRFNAEQVDQSLMGNTVEENTALRGIAGRIVDQQLAAEPAPSAIDVTLPPRGHMLTFSRRLQVDGAAPLALVLDIERVNRTSPVFVPLLLAGLALCAWLAFSRKTQVAA